MRRHAIVLVLVAVIATLAGCGDDKKYIAAGSAAAPATGQSSLAA